MFILPLFYNSSNYWRPSNRPILNRHVSNGHMTSVLRSLKVAISRISVWCSLATPMAKSGNCSHHCVNSFGDRSWLYRHLFSWKSLRLQNWDCVCVVYLQRTAVSFCPAGIWWRWLVPRWAPAPALRGRRRIAWTSAAPCSPRSGTWTWRTCGASGRIRAPAESCWAPRTSWASTECPGTHSASFSNGKQTNKTKENRGNKTMKQIPDLYWRVQWNAYSPFIHYCVIWSFSVFILMMTWSWFHWPCGGLIIYLSGDTYLGLLSLGHVDDVDPVDEDVLQAAAEVWRGGEVRYVLLDHTTNIQLKEIGQWQSPGLKYNWLMELILTDN